MKILVLSDTHGRLDAAKKLIKDINPDYTLHLGDMAEDSQRLEMDFPQKIIVSVKGNNDYFDKSYPLEREFTLCGKRFFMCHGHKYNVKSSLLALKYKGMEKNADIILFGHTHVSYMDDTDGVIMLNPGSVSTYGIIEINESDVTASVEKYK